MIRYKTIKYRQVMVSYYEGDIMKCETYCQVYKWYTGWQYVSEWFGGHVGGLLQLVTFEGSMQIEKYLLNKYTRLNPKLIILEEHGCIWRRKQK